MGPSAAGMLPFTSLGPACQCSACPHARCTGTSAEKRHAHVAQLARCPAARTSGCAACARDMVHFGCHSAGHAQTLASRPYAEDVCSTDACADPCVRAHAGKSTLLDILSQRKTTGTLSGMVLANGQPCGPEFRRTSAYVPQVRHVPGISRRACISGVVAATPQSICLQQAEPCCCTADSLAEHGNDVCMLVLSTCWCLHACSAEQAHTACCQKPANSLTVGCACLQALHACEHLQVLGRRMQTACPGSARHPRGSHLPALSDSCNVLLPSRGKLPGAGELCRVMQSWCAVQPAVMLLGTSMLSPSTAGALGCCRRT